MIFPPWLEKFSLGHLIIFFKRNSKIQSKIMINSKEQIIKYFESGIKESKDFRIGVEHEKFLFNNQDNKRIDYFLA